MASKPNFMLPNTKSSLDTFLGTQQPTNITPLPPLDLQSLGLGNPLAPVSSTGPQTLLDGTDSVTGEWNVGSGIPDKAGGGGLGFSLGDAIGIGQLGLGYLNYRDTKKYNNKAIEAMDQNIQNARTEADATAKYRKSYGA